MKNKIKNRRISQLLKDKEKEIFLVILLSCGMLVLSGLMTLGLSSLLSKYEGVFLYIPQMNEFL